MAHLNGIETDRLQDESEIVQKVMPFAGVLRCSAGESIVETGAPADCFYFVPCLRVFDHAAMARIRTEQPRLYGEFVEYVLRSVCARFRRILADRGPLTAYAAQLSTGKEFFQGLQPIPADLLGSSMLQEVNQELEKFKAEMFDVAYRLQKEGGNNTPPELQTKGEAILNNLKMKMRVQGPRIDASDAAELIWGYIFKEVFPYLMRSRFAERAYYKPKGYAGDFNMIELLYQNQPEGDGRLGTLVDRWVLNQTPARAVRSRRRLLHRLLGENCRRLGARQATVRIMNLACGPARELCDLFCDGSLSEVVEAVCVDIDPEALQFADQCLHAFSHGARINFMNMNVIKWAIGRTHQEFHPQDIIYSSGLCDYLDDRLLAALINRCHGQLKPG
ncbi:MAG: class I SAM-dependent methyltransferase, partial [Desulfosarcinaceae bacterium]